VAGSVTAVAALLLMSWHGGGLDHGRWLAFSALVYAQLIRAYANRSLVHPVWSLRPNGFLAVACVTAGVVQFLIPSVPLLADAFRATPLDGLDLALIALVAVVPAIVAEVARRRGRVPWIA
jgi:hypothetical protein